MSLNINPETGPNPLQWFLIELEAMPGQAALKDRIKAVLRSMAGQTMYLSRRDLVTGELVSQAIRDLDAGKSPRQIRAELAATGLFGRRTAERLVSAAISQRAQQAMAARQPQMQLELCGGTDD